MDGGHSIERCLEVTEATLHTVFHALWEHKVALEGLLLKPNIVLPGTTSARQAPVEKVAEATVRCLLRSVPVAVPGIVFLSGGQADELASAHLNAINRPPSPLPWPLSFSYARALQAAPPGGRVGGRRAAPPSRAARAPAPGTPPASAPPPRRRGRGSLWPSGGRASASGAAGTPGCVAEALQRLRDVLERLGRPRWIRA